VTSVVLTLSCADRLGIVQAVAGFLAERGLNIVESQQFGDADSARFFMRVHAQPTFAGTDLDRLRLEFAELAKEFEMTWELHDFAERPNVLILASRLGHCLNDLLYRYRSGSLKVAIPAVASNHPDLGDLVRSYGISFHYVPGTKEEQEHHFASLISELDIDLVVLARYMQILSPAFVNGFSGRMINIHHGLLPSFKGAGAYRQAFEGGVKVIGATAHYVCAELDEGPIIEQMVSPIDHTCGPDRIASISRDLECSTLARAVQWHIEHRVLLNGRKTVVFR